MENLPLLELIMPLSRRSDVPATRHLLILNDVIGSIQTIMNSLSDPPFPHYMWRFIKKNLQILQEGFRRTFHIFNVSFHEPQRGIALNYLSTNCRAASAS